MPNQPPLQEGLVVASYGRHCIIESADGTRRICHPRGKKNQAVVGDWVMWLPPTLGQGHEGTVEKVRARHNLFYRQDEIRTKSFAANLDQILILIAAEPIFSESQLARALIAAEAAGITPIIALNKSDLSAPFTKAWERLTPYRAIRRTQEISNNSTDESASRYTIIPLTLTQPSTNDKERLTALLKHKTTLILGPSGSGKSTLINLLIPGASVVTGEISQALNSGKHTTTSTTLYWMDTERKTALLDSPGFQEFGLQHIEPMSLAKWMPDIGNHASHCKFYNCTHLHEPGCGVIQNVQENCNSAGDISKNRYKLYSDIFHELKQTRF